MCEQEKKWQRIYDLLNAETKPKFLCLPYTKQRKIFTEKSFLWKRRSGGLDERQKEDILTALPMAIQKNPTTSIRKHANEL